MNTMWKLLLMTLCAPRVAAGEPTERPEISGRAEIILKNVRWQALPRSIIKVVVGPDGRTWYCREPRQDRSPGLWGMTVATIKEEIQREFDSPTPQFAGAEPVLFEPEGRVWFSLRPAGCLMLLGYDGKEWIDHTILGYEDMIEGHCPTAGLAQRARESFRGRGRLVPHRSRSAARTTASVGRSRSSPASRKEMHGTYDPTSITCCWPSVRTGKRP